MVLYMSFHSYIVVFYAPIPTGPRTPDFESCSIAFKLHGEGIRGSQALFLLDMWNMFGQKFLSFIGGLSVGRVQQSHLLIINR